jgi:hypothetical protein
MELFQLQKLYRLNLLQTLGLGLGCTLRSFFGSSTRTRLGSGQLRRLGLITGSLRLLEKLLGVPGWERLLKLKEDTNGIQWDNIRYKYMVTTFKYTDF